ncbi:putative multidrug resistance protein fnx1 [Hypomontagnella monticulosa]|nr:putative multidrug resistance protein fnx1 [Hypomontagnella monticulosa]
MTLNKPSSGAEAEKAADVEVIQAVRFNYISGWRLYIVALGLGLTLFLVNFEVTIVSAALVSITDDLQDFSRTSWIVTGYLITYIGGLVIWARISDLLGRKKALLVALLIFCAFSGGSGGAQTMIQLIIFRVLQGLGGSGIFSISMVMFYELVPPEKYPKCTSVVMVMYALSLVLGPIIGGVISLRASWRWVFLLNVPAGVLLGCLLFLVVPGDFPYQGLDRPKKQLSLRDIDVPGALLLLASMILLITGFEEAASILSWTSGTVLGPIIASIVTWIAFLASSWHASRPGSFRESVFPWRLCTNRLIIGLFLNAFTTGAVGVTCIILIPVRYQTAVQSDPLQAALRLIPFTAAGPTGTVIVATLAKGRRIPPIYLTFVAELLQIIGLVFISQGSGENEDWPALWGLEVLVALGMGGCMGTLTLLTPIIVGEADLTIGTAAFNQFRVLGGAMTLAIVTAVGNNWVKSKLSGFLTNDELMTIFASTATIDRFPPNIESLVRDTFAQSFGLQMRILLGIAVAAIFTTLLMWQRVQIKIP